jgi:hypothetical protein
MQQRELGRRLEGDFEGMVVNIFVELKTSSEYVRGISVEMASCLNMGIRCGVLPHDQIPTT